MCEEKKPLNENLYLQVRASQQSIIRERCKDSLPEVFLLCANCLIFSTLLHTLLCVLEGRWGETGRKMAFGERT